MERAGNSPLNLNKMTIDHPPVRIYHENKVIPSSGLKRYDSVILFVLRIDHSCDMLSPRPHRCAKAMIFLSELFRDISCHRDLKRFGLSAINDPLLRSSLLTFQHRHQISHRVSPIGVLHQGSHSAASSARDSLGSPAYRSLIRSERDEHCHMPMCIGTAAVETGANNATSWRNVSQSRSKC
jgi:hypothetical protein